MGQGLFLGNSGPSLFSVLSPGAKHSTIHPLPGIQFLFFSKMCLLKTASELHPDGALQNLQARGCNTVFPEVNQIGQHMLPYIWRFYLYAIAKLYHNGIGNLVLIFLKYLGYYLIICFKAVSLLIRLLKNWNTLNNREYSGYSCVF